MDDIGVKIIPDLYHFNDVSPTEDRIVKIYNNGDVDFFIKCGDLGFGSGDETQYTYCKFSFKVKKNFYGKNYNSVDDFAGDIQNEQIEDLTVSVIKPTADLNDINIKHMNDVKLSSNTKIKDILNDMKFIGGAYWTDIVTKILVRYGQKKDTIKFLEDNFQEIMEFMKNIKNEELTQLKKKDKQELEKKDKELTQLKNEKQDLKLQLNNKDKDFEQQLNKINEDFNKQLKEREKEHAILLNKKDEEYAILLEGKDEVLKQLDEVLKQKDKENQGLGQLLNKKDEEYAILLEGKDKELSKLKKEKQSLKKQLEEKDKKYNKVLEDNQGLGQLLEEKDEVLKQKVKENEELKQQLEEKNEDLKGTLYKKKDKGFLSIFSYCTCGLDKVAEMKEEENEIK